MNTRCNRLSVAGLLSVIAAAGCSGGQPETSTDTASATDGRTLTVTPNSGLLAEQTVTVRGTGYPPDSSVWITQCSRNVINVSHPFDALDLCTYGTHPVPDASGTFETTLNVARRANSMGTAEIFCGDPDACFVAQAGAYDLVVPLGFEQPTGNAQLTVTPNTGLADLQLVSIAGSNLGSGGAVELAICKTGADLGPPRTFGTLSPTECFTYSGFAFATGSGQLTQTRRVHYTVRPPAAPPFTCSNAGDCMFVAKSVNADALPATTPITFRAMGAARRGVVQVGSAPVPAGGAIAVTGSGWASNATLQVSLCPAGASIAQCLPEDGVALGTSGALSTNVTAASALETAQGLADCTTAGACVVRVADSRDPAGTVVDVPYTVQASPVAAGSAELDLRAPLVDRLTARVKGSGFGPSRTLRQMICEGATFARCQQLPRITTDASGGFRVYSVIRETFLAEPHLDCAAAANKCSLVVADDAGLTASAVRIPLTFAAGDTFQVVTKYGPEFQTVINEGVRLSGLPVEELQRQGALVAAYVVVTARIPTGAHYTADGTASYASTYDRSTYLGYTALAASAGYTLDELQKAGTVLYAYILSGGQLPLPPTVTP